MHLVVRGRVQGVFYRASALHEARRLLLTGWVRNCADGSVALVAEGPRRACEQLLRFCRKGPHGARVDDVEISWGAATGEYTDFEVRA
ncbi:MAG: acylphosphatase [Acidobacteriota bacterium]